MCGCNYLVNMKTYFTLRNNRMYLLPKCNGWSYNGSIPKQQF